MQKRVFIVSIVISAMVCTALSCTEDKSADDKSYAGQVSESGDSGTRGEITGSAEDQSDVASNAGSGNSTTDGSSSPTAGTGKNKGAGGAASAAGIKSGAANGGAGGATVESVESTDCCAEHTSSGCEDSAIQTCICEMLPDCCSKAWSRSCVLLTEGHYCEPAVRDCVCKPEAEGGWAQESCCSQEWTNLCEYVASEKCKAEARCID
jgi:hypothetical protein